MKMDGNRIAGAAILLLAVSSLVYTSSLAQGPPPAGGNQAGPQDKIKVAAALPTPRMADGHPDLSGYWTTGNGGGSSQGKAVTPDGQSVRPIVETVDNQVAGEAARLASRKADTSLRPKYKPQFVATAENNFERATFLDPAYKCLPQGVPRLGAPTEILQHGDAVVLLYPQGDNNNSLSSFRVIPTNNPPHDPDADSMSNGDSVGHWEGDTLVVDVTNIDPDTWLDGDGSFHDQNLHVIEKFTRQGNTLRYEVTEDDPTLFAETFVRKPKVLLLGKASQHAEENYPCQERDQGNFKDNARP